jgi:hypothetical protein
MVLRRGSLRGALAELDEATRSLLLEDYALARRRDHCSRSDFAAGWLALARRIRLDDGETQRLIFPKTLTPTAGT